jgi:transcriptional regulator with XRE-family HTH domain
MVKKPEPTDPPIVFDEIVGPLTDRVVDAFLTTEAGVNDIRSRRIRGAFARRLISSRHSAPVRRVEPIWTFGRWIENARTALSLDVADLAAAINVEPATIERLERSDVLPWTLGESVITNLVSLFRLHIAAVEQLFIASQTVLRGQMGTTAIARSSLLDSSARADVTRRALDRFLAAKSGASDQNAESQEAIQAVRRGLELRGDRELLDP